MIKNQLSLIAFIVSLIPWVASAEQSVSFGDYTLHYNTVTTDLLDPGVARAYDIVRSKNRALINVAVLRSVMGMAAQPTRAEISTTATNLSAQLKSVPMRELNDGGAIYYIGEVPVSNEETLDFSVSVKPEGADAPYQLKFREQFFTN